MTVSERSQRGSGAKLCQGKLRLHVRKNFFSVKVVKRWNRLPREVPDAHTCQCSREVCTVPSITSFNAIRFVDAYRNFAY